MLALVIRLAFWAVIIALILPYFGLIQFNGGIFAAFIATALTGAGVWLSSLLAVPVFGLLENVGNRTYTWFGTICVSGTAFIGLVLMGAFGLWLTSEITSDIALVGLLHTMGSGVILAVVAMLVEG